MYICNLEHLATLPEGTIFAKYSEDEDGFHVGGFNRLTKVNGEEVGCLPISSQYHDSKMDSSFSCYMRVAQKVKDYNISGEDYPVTADGVDSIICSDDNYMFAIYSKEDIDSIIAMLQAP